MVTRFADLADLAERNLAVATIRRAHPSATPDPNVAPYLMDLAHALAHLGATIGTPTQPAHDLHRALTRQRRPHPNDASDRNPTGISRDIAEATLALRSAADLIASTGPLPENLTDRYLEHSEWTHPRPEHLTSSTTRAAAWSHLADLALAAADLGAGTGDPELGTLAAGWGHAALRVPRTPPDAALGNATPGWPLPLPRHPIPNEWDGRMNELTAMSWRLAHTEPIAPQPALRHIAEIGYHVHRQAAAAPEIDPAAVHALRARAEVWSRIHDCVHAITTPMHPLSPAQRYSLFRTLQLTHTGTLDAADLTTGRTALAQAATWAPAALAAYTEHPAVGIGPTLPPDLRTAHRGVLLASLNRRTVRIPARTLHPLVELYRQAAQPVAGTPVVRPTVSGRLPHLRQVPTPAARGSRSPGPTATV